MSDLAPLTTFATVAHLVFLAATLSITGRDTPAAMPSSTPPPRLISASDMLLLAAAMHLTAAMAIPISAASTRPVRVATHLALFLAFTAWFALALFVFCFSVGRTSEFVVLIVIEYFTCGACAFSEFGYELLAWNASRTSPPRETAEQVDMIPQV